MAVRVLGQAAPAATTDTDVYTVPAGKTSVISTVSVCNQGAAATYRVAVRAAGAAITQKAYHIYDAPITANTTHFLTIGLTLAAADVLTVRASSGSFSFNLSGDES